MANLRSSRGRQREDAIDFNPVPLETMVMQCGQTIKFKKIGLKVTCHTDVGAFPLCCKRLITEKNDTKVNIEEEEEYCSDVFAHRIGRIQNSIQCDVIIPLFPSFTGLEAGEELAVKRNKGRDILITNLFQEDEHWFCAISADLQDFSSFVVVSRPKKEVFEIGAEATTIQSTVDERVEMDIPENAFEEPTKVTMKITEASNIGEEYDDDDDYEDILSATAFYNIEAEGSNPTKSINVKVPLPEKFKGEGKIVVLTMDEDEDDEDETKWKVLDEDGNVVDGRLVFEVNSFSVKVGIESASFGSLTELKRQVSILYRKSRRREYPVSFLALTRAVETTATFQTVVECCLEEQIESRRQHWIKEGFEDQQQTSILTSTAVSKQSMKIKVSDGIKLIGSEQEVTLQFHPKRENFQCFGTAIIGSVDSAVGHVEIFKLEKAVQEGSNNDILETLQTSIVVELKKPALATEEVPDSEPAEAPPEDTPDSGQTGLSEATENEPVKEQVPVPIESPIARRMREIKEVRKKKKTSKSEFTGFTRNKFMKWFVKNLEEEWFKVLLLLDIPLQDIETVVSGKGELKSKLFQLLVAWRDESLNREDLGVPAMFSALNKGGRRDFCIQAQSKMKKWFDTKAKQKKSQPETDDTVQLSEEEKKLQQKDETFYQWVIKAYRNPDVLLPVDYPVPLSDMYLALVADDSTQSCPEVAKALGLSDDSLEVLESAMYNNEGFKMVKILAIFRDQNSDITTSLSDLLKRLEQTETKDVRRKLISIARSWCKLTAKEDDPLKTVIEELLSGL